VTASPDLSRAIRAANRFGEWASIGDDAGPSSLVERGGGSVVSGTALRRIMCAKNPPSRVRLRGVDIVGDVDLSGVQLAGELAFDQCSFRGGTLRVAAASLGALRITNSILCGDLDATESLIQGPVVIDGSEVTGSIFARDARIGGRFSAVNTKFGGRPLALDLEGATLDGSMQMQRCMIAGEMILRAAQVAGGINLSAASLRGFPVSLQAENASVSGPIFMNHGLRAAGTISVHGAHFGAELNFSDAFLGTANANGVALSGQNLKVQTDVFLNQARVHGTVELQSALVGGQLNLTATTVRDCGAISLEATGIRIGTNCWLNEGFAADGSVVLSGGTIGGLLSVTRSVLNGSQGDALRADRCEVRGNVWLQEVRARGCIRISASVLRGHLDAAGADLSDPGGPALDLGRTAVATNVVLSAGFTAVGGVVLLGTSVGGSVEISDATLLANGTGRALDASSLRVDDTLSLLRSSVCGEVRLAASRASRLCDDRSYWDCTATENQACAGHPAGRRNVLDLAHFDYRRLDRVGARWTDHCAWLEHMPRYHDQPYVLLAATERASGRDRDARRINMRRHWRRLDAESPGPGRVSRLGERLLGIAIGFGYAPWRVAVWLSVLVAFGALLYERAADRGLIVPTRAGLPAAESVGPSPTRTEGGMPVVATKCTDAYPCFNPLVYSLETGLPAVKLGQRDYWSVSTRTAAGGWAAVFTWMATLAGWVLATLVAVSFTNVVKRE
jgi:uncharacterized protein YjbI with pentapeptide repeats